MQTDTYESLAGLVDLPLLEARLTADQVYAGCELAREYRIRAVVVRPCDFELVSGWMEGSGVVTATTAGYPDGTSTTATKLYEGRDLLRLGAKELEFVLNPARMFARSFQSVEMELLQIARSAHEGGARITLVFPPVDFADDLKIIATKVAKRTEFDTLSVAGSEAELALLKPLLKDVLRLKRSTPVTSLEEALTARDAGFRSFTLSEPKALLDAWKAHLAAQAQPAPVVS